MPADLILRLDEASRAVARLDGVGETLDNPYLLIRPFIRREAVLSSRIEGTQASVADVYEFEVSGRARARDVGEVANYVAAMELGLRRLDELPVCVRLANELHAQLMEGVRGSDLRPGTFRDRQVWSGDEGTPITAARFVPPPHTLLVDLMSDWEKWVNAEFAFPPLIRAALLHYQFEAIHPYLDGNGRLGRLLVVLYLIAAGVLKTPLLYLSSFFERNRAEYYGHLLAVSQTGDWLPWLEFFLRGAREQANDAVARSRSLRELQREYRRRLQEERLSANTLLLADQLFQTPVLTRPLIQKALDVSPGGARLLVQRLIDRGMLHEIPDSRPALFIAREILDLVEGQ